MAQSGLTDEDVFGPGAFGPPAVQPQATVAPPTPVGVQPLPNVPGYVSDPTYTPPVGQANNPTWQAPAVPLGGAASQDGMTDAQVFGSMPGVQAAPQAAGLKADQGLGLYAGGMHVLDNAAKGLEWLAGKAGLPTQAIDQGLGMPSAAQAADAHQAYIASQAARGVRPGKIGEFGGNVLASLPLVADMGPLAAGAVAGALTTNAKDAKGVAIDAGLGAAGGKVMSGALSGLKSVVSPVISPAVEALLRERVGLTPGQIMGGAAHRLEDGATSIPIFGDIIKNAQARGMQDFNRAAINRSLAPIGEKLPDTLSSGYEAVDHAHRVLGQAYDELLPGLTAKVDPTFTSNIENLRNLAGNLTGDYARKFNHTLQTEVLDRIAPKTGVITGDGLKDAESQLGLQAAKFGKIQDGHAQDFADSVRQLQAEVRGLVQRSNPAVADRLADINKGYANLVRVENASSRLGATGGVFTPAQLDGAARATDNSVRKTASARGNALMQDLATAGKEVLPSTVPDSGSPLRHALEATVALLVGQEAHTLPLMLKGAAAGGVIGSAYTKAGQKIVTPLLTKRPLSAPALAQAMERLRPLLQAGGGAAPAQVRSNDPMALPAR